MSGKKRFAVIFATFTSLVGTGGGTAYYLNQSGRLPWLVGATTAESASASRSVADKSSLATADLSAVESAWIEAAGDADATSMATTTQPDRTTIARSAEETLTGAEPPAELNSEPSTEDRYGLATDTTLADVSAVDHSAHNDTLTKDAAAAESNSSDSLADAEPTPADSRHEVALDRPEPEESIDAAASQPVGVSDPSGAIARGQEPGDEPNVLPTDSDGRGSVSGNALRATTADPADSSTARRAREAFQGQGLSPASDRYGSGAATPGAHAANTAESAQAVNPFGAGPTPIASGTEPAELEAIEPLAEEASAAAGDGLGTMQALDAAPSTIRTPVPNPYGDGPGEYGRASARSASSDNSTNTIGVSEPVYGDSRSTMSGGEGTGRPGERALEGPQNPALVMQKIAPPEIQVGKKAKFLIKVQNVGSQTAEEVIIRDEVPQGTRLAATSPTAEVSGAQLTWNIGKLSTGEERTVEVELMPTTEGEIGSVATVSYSGQASVKTRCTMPQLAIRMTAPDEVMIGHEQRVKIELHNPGSGDAINVMLFENVPENVRHAAGPALEFEIGTLKAGEMRELELILLAEKAGKVVNVLSARAEGNLQVQQQVEFEVIAPAISVAVDGPGRRYLERPATYQVIIENPGTAPARDVELVTKLPKGLRFVKANNMGEYDAGTHAVYWSLAELPEGESGTVELTAMPVETGTQTLAVEGRAQQGLADETTQQIEIEGLPSIMFEVRDAEDPIEIGDETSYEIRVVNEGTKAATNVQVAIGLTPGMQVVSAEGESRHAIQGPSVVFEPLPQLAPKADAVYHVKVKGVQAGDQRINVEVKTDDLSQPIRREESTRVFGDE